MWRALAWALSPLGTPHDDRRPTSAGGLENLAGRVDVRAARRRVGLTKLTYESRTGTERPPHV